MGLAAVVLLAVSWAPAQEPPCLSVYTPDFQEKAGIDPQEWSRVCASGADPKGYFLQRLKETKKAKPVEVSTKKPFDSEKTTKVAPHKGQAQKVEKKK